MNGCPANIADNTAIVITGTTIYCTVVIRVLSTWCSDTRYSNCSTVDLDKYLQVKYQLLMKQNVFARAEQLSQEGNRHAFAERLDQDVLRAILSAEKKLRLYAEPAWSQELSNARKRVSRLSQRLSVLRTGLQPSDNSSIYSLPPLPRLFVRLKQTFAA